MKYAGFLLIIMVSNIIQGITGFAGTILAMPPSLMLVGYDTAKPILNVLGLLSGIYVLFGHWRHVCLSELKRIVIVMTVGIFAGIGLKSFLAGQEALLYKLLGTVVVLIAAQGFMQMHKANSSVQSAPGGAPASFILLGAAGIVHGMFVSGGPLLIGYLTKRIEDKVSFRATISAVWVVLNTIILADDIRSGMWNPELLKLQMVCIPFLLAGMAVGTKIVKIMSQRFFMLLTYILLGMSGISLLVK